MSEFVYFTRLIEMSGRRSPTESTRISHDESDKETGENTNKRSNILQQNSILNFQPDIKPNDSKSEVKGFNSNPKLSNIHRPEYKLEISRESTKEQIIPEIPFDLNKIRNQPKEIDVTFSTPISRSDTTPAITKEDNSEKNQQKRNDSEPESPISTSPSPTLPEGNKFNVKNDIQNKMFLQSLLDNSSSINNSIRENIDRLIHSKFDQVSVRQEELNESRSSSVNKSKNPAKDRVTVSIGTIMIKITDADKENDRIPMQINSHKSDKQNIPDLRRYYVKLR